MKLVVVAAILTVATCTASAIPNRNRHHGQFSEDQPAHDNQYYTVYVYPECHYSQRDRQRLESVAQVYRTVITVQCGWTNLGAGRARTEWTVAHATGASRVQSITAEFRPPCKDAVFRLALQLGS